MKEREFCFYVNVMIILLEAWIGYLVVEYEIGGGFWFMMFLLLFLHSPDNKDEDDDEEKSKKEK